MESKKWINLKCFWFFQSFFSIYWILRIVVIEDNQPTLRWFKTFKTKFPQSGNNSVFKKWGEAIERITWETSLFIIDYHLNLINSRAMDGIKVMMKLRMNTILCHFGQSSQEDATVSANTIKLRADDYVAKIIRKHQPSWQITAIGNVLHNTYLQQDIKSPAVLFITSGIFVFYIDYRNYITKIFYPDRIWSMPTSYTEPVKVRHHNFGIYSHQPVHFLIAALVSLCNIVPRFLLWSGAPLIVFSGYFK